MDKVIGLGKMGCAIAEELTAYPEYRIYKIDTDIEERASLSLGTLSAMDEYEQAVDTDEVAIYLRSIKANDEILMVVEGGTSISGATLAILETIKNARINVLYICPDREMVSGMEKRDDKISFHILQEYARSGVFENIFLVHKPIVETLVGDVSIHDYEQSVSYFISYIVAMLNYFKHTPPILDSSVHKKDFVRITTFGISSLEETSSVNLLFPLKDTSHLHFFYGIPEPLLEEDATLMKKIKNHSKRHKADSLGVGFTVHGTTFEEIMVICAASSHKIQQLVLS
jgi:hypothetical protein